MALSTAARAQSGPAISPALTPAAGAKPPAAPAVPEAPPAAPDPGEEVRRLDEIEQMARIAAHQHELLQARAREAPRLTIDEKGFALSLPDRSYVLRVRGIVQGDGRFFADSDTLQANDTFLIRKFRPSLEGTLLSIVDYRLVPELAGGVQILDAYSDLHPWPWLRLRVGKMKAPVGLERLQGEADRPFLEQSLVQNLSSQRDVGVQLWGEVAGGLVTYVIGIFNGAPDTTSNDTDTNHAKDFQGRLFIQPFKSAALAELGTLGFGISAGTGNRNGTLPVAVSGLPIPTTPAVTGLSPFRTAGQRTFFQYLAPATDTTGASTVFAHERATRINPQLYYYYASAGLLAEYLWLRQGVQKGNLTTELTNQAAAVTVSFSIGGTENYDGSTPEHPFDIETRHWGALQLAARWSWIAVDDATFSTYANPAASARSANAFGAGVTWAPRRSLHYALSFEQTRFDGGAGTAATATAAADIKNRATENVVIGRAQVNF